MTDLPKFDDTIQCVQNIVESARCPNCDCCDGTRKRLICGHPICSNCLSDIQECPQCYTVSFPQPTFADLALCERVKNSSQLLKTCQETYNKSAEIKKNRMSEHLKVERDLFPHCIQAPVKYYNKRKISDISNTSTKKRRSTSIMPGEKISSVVGNNVNNNNYVLQWLNQHYNELSSNRSPFTNLNINSPILRKSLRRKILVNNDHYEKILPHTPKKMYEYKRKSKQLSRAKKEHDKCKNLLIQNIENNYINPLSFNSNNEDESGIVIEDDSITIEDSQNEVVDKDNLAWFAVLNAKEQEDVDSTCLNSGKKIMRSNGAMEKENTITNFKVPFLKRSELFETCSLCRCMEPIDKRDDGLNNVTVKIDNKDFVTIIKVSKDIKIKAEIPSKVSTSVQTDICKSNKKKINELDNKNVNERDKNTEEVKGTKYQYWQDVNQEQRVNEGDLKNVNYLKSKNVIEKSKIGNEIEVSKDHLCLNVIQQQKTMTNKNESEVKNYNLSQSIINEKYISCIKSQHFIKKEGQESEPRSRLVVIEESESNGDSNDTMDISEKLICDSLLSFPKKTNYKLRKCTPASSDSSEKENFDPNRIKKYRGEKKCVKKPSVKLYK